jgi:hypothetical protein
MHDAWLGEAGRQARLDATLTCIHASIIGQWPRTCAVPAPHERCCSTPLLVVLFDLLHRSLTWEITTQPSMSRSMPCHQRSPVVAREQVLLPLVSFPAAARVRSGRGQCSSRLAGRVQGCMLHGALRAQPSPRPGHACETVFVLGNLFGFSRCVWSESEQAQRQRSLLGPRAPVGGDALPAVPAR